MLDEKVLFLVTQIILIVSAINWGLVAYNGTDLVRLAVGNFDKYAKMVVGVVGIYAAYKLYLMYKTVADEQPTQ